jgi:bacterioferritin (cytochrome b1)
MYCNSQHSRIVSYIGPLLGALKTCVVAGDEGSRALFEHMIKDEERHADFLESQLHSIKEMGIATTSRNSCTATNDLAFWF